MDIIKLLTDKEQELEPVFKRMREDEKQIYAKSFKLKNAKGNEAKGAYSVNMLGALHFITKAIARLTGVKRQALIKSDDMDPKKLEGIEHFLDDLQLEIDARLNRKGEMDAFSQHAEIVCARGPIAEQILLGMKKGVFIPESRPLDTLYFLYEMDADGMHWGCPFHKRRAVDILAQYPKATVSGKTGIVKDYWDDKLEIIYVDGQKVDELPNPYGYPPFVISFPSTTSALRSDDYLKRMGDSILHLCRSDSGEYLFDEVNFIASILKTQASETLKPPQQKKPKQDGSIAAKEESYAEAGDIISVDSEIIPIPKPDVRLSTQMFSQKVDATLERGTYSALEFGVIDLPLAFVTVNRMQENKGDLLLPRLNCLAQLCQAASRMKIDQFTKLATTIKIGEEGHKRSYKPSDMEGEYTIQYRFHTTSQEQLAAGASISAALGDLVDDEFKLDDLLKLQNPTEMLARRDAQAAKKNNPAILFFEQVMALIEEQEESSDETLKMEMDAKATLHYAQLLSILKQRKASENVPLGQPLETTSKEKEPSGLMPVFAQGKSKSKKEGVIGGKV